MSASLPAVDVNVFAYNAEATIGAALESVLAQSWPALGVTVIDNGSTDGTLDVVERMRAAAPQIRVLRARANGGAVVNCQRAFGAGEADYVLPKTADDVLAPDFVARIMDVMLAYPGCAMCHAAGLIFDGDLQVRGVYPASHLLHAIGPDPVARACHVMAHYTSAPSFWGIYRRSAVDRLAPFRYRAGWDHAVLAELAVYGEIRHVPQPLYWRRDGGKPVALIARGCTESVQRGLGLQDSTTDLRWMTPLITTAYTHLETFAVARLEEPVRAGLMADALRVLRARWLAPMQAEAAGFARALPGLRARAAAAAPPLSDWMRAQIEAAALSVATVLPDAAAALAA